MDHSGWGLKQSGPGFGQSRSPTGKLPSLLSRYAGA